MNPRRPRLAIPVILSISALFSADSITADSSAADDLVTVEVVEATRGALTRTTTQPAAVHPFFRAQIASRVSGYVKSLNVDLGDHVKAGDILAEIDAPELRTQAERKEAEILLLKSKTKQLEASKLSVAAQTKAEELEFERVSRLAESGAITVKVRDEAESRVGSARAGMAVVTAEVEGSKAAVIVAEKELEELVTMVGFSEIKAPFDGVITHRDIDPGDLVNASSGSGKITPLFEVAQINKVRIVTTVPEFQSIYADQSDAAVFGCRALPGVEFKGEVSRTSGSINTKSGSMTVEIDIDNTEGKLLPGLFGEATIILETFTDVVLAPASAVRFDETGNASVYLVSDSTVSIVPVSTGLDDGNTIQITDGLKGGESLISGMLGRFSDGDRVNVAKPSNP
tara:strand:- start:422 stop:1618 length:1197 start_codon:yes stop_codon:yes gene_type:complete